MEGRRLGGLKKNFDNLELGDQSVTVGRIVETRMYRMRSQELLNS